MNLSPVNLSDRDWVRSLVSSSGELGCEYCFGNIYMWSEIYSTQIGRCGNFLVSREVAKAPSYLYPVGNGDDAEFAAVIEAFIADSRAHGIRFRMHRVSEEGKARIQRLFPDRFSFIAEPDDFDYIYSRQELDELAGSKFHSKRNFDARFYSHWPEAVFEPLTADNLPECVNMTRIWMAGKSADDAEAEIELGALKKGFEHFFELDYRGGLLRADGKIAAYTFGEAINERCFVSHAEKALPEYEGAYAAINRAMAHYLEGFELINREEDMGREGLRKAKQSYHPVILYTKYKMVEKIHNV